MTRFSADDFVNRASVDVKRRLIAEIGKIDDPMAAIAAREIRDSIEASAGQRHKHRHRAMSAAMSIVGQVDIGIVPSD